MKSTAWLAGLDNRLRKQLGFLIEVDRLKTVIRGNRIGDGSRRENTAEHSWHLAMLASTLAEYAVGDIDVSRVVQMLLIHDVVEIDAGDTPLFETSADGEQERLEHLAADRLFGLLPEDQAGCFRSLWTEFEDASTPDARFAKAVDRLQPILLNHVVGGGTWTDYQIDERRERELTNRIALGAPALWEAAEEVFADAVANGWLLPDPGQHQRQQDRERDKITPALATYYDQEAFTRHARSVDPQRRAWREQFMALLEAEHRGRVLEIGSGPGRDSTAFAERGVSLTALELSMASCRLLSSADIAAIQGSLFELPVRPGSFDGGWTMSTLMHVPDSRFDDALSEICAALRPGSPLGIGLWGGIDWEGRRQADTIDPPRFFSFRSHERTAQMLARHGNIELFETKDYKIDDGTIYQFAILRIPERD